MSGLQMPHDKAERERDLQPNETADIWRAAEQEQYPYSQLLRFAMLVPGRIWTEVGHIKRTDVVDGRWNHHTTKTGRRQWLPLPQMALDILDECPEVSEYFFRGPVPTGCQQQIKRRINKRCDVENWTYHDFREAFITRLGDLGAPLDLADEIQRPKSKRQSVVGRHYDRSSRTEEKGELLEYWAYVMRCYLEGKEPIRWRDYIRGADVISIEAA